uniref:Nuclear protein UL55 n=1 Tax=Human herpesvirus 1 TaxID=10298 RepID=F8RDN1_HHV1|nr:truncated nuclear protein UL55 [Human alphaherpesvirus 1]AKG60613.1 nuclear protein UL55 [Human alphaherpesvirus 1]WJJ52592.1 nuclear protein UL55 [Human alphaherpesvirus 1]
MTATPLTNLFLRAPDITHVAPPLLPQRHLAGRNGHAHQQNGLRLRGRAELPGPRLL